VRAGILIDHIGNFQRSASTGLPVYRVTGGAGYVWAASWDQAGRGTLRFLTIVASRLAPSSPNAGQDVSSNAPATPSNPPSHGESLNVAPASTTSAPVAQPASQPSPQPTTTTSPSGRSAAGSTRQSQIRILGQGCLAGADRTRLDDECARAATGPPALAEADDDHVASGGRSAAGSTR
jgi:hypothetical protein